MNRLLSLASLFAAFAAPLAAAPADVASGDTVVVNDAREVFIVTTDSTQSITINGTRENHAFTLHREMSAADANFIDSRASEVNEIYFSILLNRQSKKNKYSVDIVMDLGLGWNDALAAPAAMDVRTFSSWEIWWIITRASWRPFANSRHSFSAGFGLDWRNYRMTNGTTRFDKQGGTLLLTDYPADSRGKYSRIKVFSLNFPLQYHFKTRHAGFSVGPVVNLNVHSSVRTKYVYDGHRHREKANDVHVTPVTVDLMGTVTLFGVTGYVKYCPMNVLDTQYAPKFKSISFGWLF